MLERATTENRRSGKSAKAIAAQRRAERPGNGEGPNRNDGEKRRLSLEDATTPNRPSGPPALGTVETIHGRRGQSGAACRADHVAVSFGTAGCGPACGGAGGVGRQFTAARPYSDYVASDSV